jgi:hypothetical protein
VVDERQELMALHSRLTCRCPLRHMTKDTDQGQ